MGATTAGVASPTHDEHPGSSSRELRADAAVEALDAAREPDDFDATVVENGTRDPVEAPGRYDHGGGAPDDGAALPALRPGV